MSARSAALLTTRRLRAAAKKRLDDVKLMLDSGLSRTDESIARLAVAMRHKSSQRHDGARSLSASRSCTRRTMRTREAHHALLLEQLRYFLTNVGTMIDTLRHNTEENPSLGEVKWSVCIWRPSSASARRL